MNDFMSEIERETKVLREWNKKWEKIHAPIVKHNNKGIAFEKDGEIKKAIGEYEKCLQWMYDHFDGEYLKQIAWHSPNRLRVIYKKEKHPKEREFLETFISFCELWNIEVPETFRNQLAKLQ
jgi:hypothetical protein